MSFKCIIKICGLPLFYTKKNTVTESHISQMQQCKKFNLQYIFNKVFALKDIQTYLTIVFRGFHFMAELFQLFDL